MAFDVKRLDIYRKIPKDLTQPTTTGGLVSIACVTFIFVMLASELVSFVAPDIRSELLVDSDSNPTDRIPVRLNISLPGMKCEFLGIDIQDDMGRHEVGFVENTLKTPINGDSGCLFEARFHINRVPGNFHVSTHSVDDQPDDYDFSHVVHELTIGSRIKKIAAKGIGSFNALGGRQKLDSNGLESHEYVMKIVPTTYVDLAQTKLVAYQYTYAYRSYVSFGHGGRVVPAIWFRYDLNPITVRYHETRPPLYHFVTTICAIVGGTFTVAGIIDSCIFTATEIFKKFEIGNLS